jgi:hypothetical protein
MVMRVTEKVQTLLRSDFEDVLSLKWIEAWRAYHCPPSPRCGHLSTPYRGISSGDRHVVLSCKVVSFPVC